MNSGRIKAPLISLIEMNPKETFIKGHLGKKIGMDKLQPFSRDVLEYEIAEFNGGSKFRNGDTIMARITPCLENGKTAMINILDENEVGFGSTEYIVFRAKEGYTTPDFVYYLISSSFVRDPAIKSMVGSSGRQRVQTDVLQALEISVPPLDEQKKIASILKGLDDKIALNNAINCNLEQQARAIYQNMIIDNQSDEWEIGKLSDIAEITMGQSPKGDTYNENGIGTVFYQGRAEFGSRFPTRRLFTTEPKRMANEYDVLLSVRAPVGDLNIATEPCCIGRGLGAIHSIDNHQSFVLYTMLAVRKQLDIFNGEGTVFGSINKEALNAISVIIPDKPTLDRFETIVAPIDSAIRTNYEEICRLQNIRDTLLPKLMNGEIDVSEVEI